MCGIVGITDHREAARLTHLALFSQQHRGQESAGIAVAQGAVLRVHRAMGLVQDVLGGLDFTAFKGKAAVGHVRYSTAGGSLLENAQPLSMQGVRGAVAVAHNGNLVNAVELRQALERDGAIFQGTTDTEVILHLVARAPGTYEEAVATALQQCRGSFSLVFLVISEGRTRMIAVRDPWGFRPLVVGKLGRGMAFASETCALDMIGARFIRELEPGEMVVAESGRMSSSRPFRAERSAACVFEQVYFARPDSVVFGATVQAARTEMGRQLAQQMAGVKADAVVPVPDSGVHAALGFAAASGIPFQMGLIRNHYVGRTFIQPSQVMRELSVRMKLHPVREVLENRRVVLVDDSIVRGTTSRKIVRLLRRCRVKEVHLAISSPPIIGPCYYGIDTPAEDQLIAANKTNAEIAKFLGVESLTYLEQDRLLGAVRTAARRRPAPPDYCTACFSRDYPTDVPTVPLGRVGRTSLPVLAGGTA
ncbi:MAG: amidophosphoribosyltransferase [Deltaproteobacteria bacterium]|nr:amidophosphoribosyltransferase [Deltaproteobacteria bacterium]